MKTLGRFTSRKFILAIVGILYGILNNQPELVTASILAFLAAEGVADTAGRFTGNMGDLTQVPNDFDAVDRSKIVTGVGSIRDADAED